VCFSIKLKNSASHSSWCLAPTLSSQHSVSVLHLFIAFCFATNFHSLQHVECHVMLTFLSTVSLRDESWRNLGFLLTGFRFYIPGFVILRRMKTAGHVARAWGQKRCTQGFDEKKREGSRALGRSRCRLKVNIKMWFEMIMIMEGVGWNNLAEYTIIRHLWIWLWFLKTRNILTTPLLHRFMPRLQWLCRVKFLMRVWTWFLLNASWPSGL
jgi:hypothetical protein